MHKQRIPTPHTLVVDDEGRLTTPHARPALTYSVCLRHCSWSEASFSLFFEGTYDYPCAYPLAKEYFEQLNAPVKVFYTFAHSAHSPMFEKPEKMLKILQQDVLAGTNNLADTK